MDGSFEDALDKSITLKQLMAKIEELKAARTRAEMKIAILEAVN